MMPYETHPEMIAMAPTAAAFVPGFAIEEIRSILIDDEKIHADEQNAFGTVGDLSLEKDIVDLGAEHGTSPFRLVSIRIDPCGNSIGRLKSGEACSQEVRIVWQPMEIVEGKASTKDVNLHSIHRLDSQSFNAFITGLRALRTSSAPADEALQPHPIMSREGLKGPYFAGLVKLLTQYVGPKNLKRVAFFADTNPTFLGHWPLLAFDIEEAKVVRNPSPTLGAEEGETQKLVQRIEGAPNRLGEPFPKGDFENNLFPVISEPTATDDASMFEFAKTFLLKKYNSAVALENPTIHEPGNSDCASCHMAVMEKWQIEQELTGMGVTVPGGEYTSDHFNLTSNVKPGFSKTSLQIFSFFSTQAKISPRAVNDAALSADRLNMQR